VLEPLDTSHAHALSHQYRDGQIAVMTGLPQMRDTEKIKKWIIESNQESGRVNFAVVHMDWGFVGFINFAISDYAAFFCFWTGVDFQGRGYATIAGRLACRHAKECGVPLILTSAYKDNLRSIRALKRMGFDELEIRACPPDHERIFFSLYDRTECTFDNNRELIKYYRRENLPMEFENFSESNNQISNQTTATEKAP
jgi:RimJ/RimL family protein N-acetyltransferase